MEKLKEALIQFAHSNPSLFPNAATNSYPMLIDQCFPQFFPDYQTPNHPPYAAMIYKALWELNKKGGSSEELISNYIQNEYAELPWAHSTLLKHHLEKLCDRKEICMTNNQCYLLAGAESEPEKKNNGPSKKRKRQTGQLGSEAGKESSRPCKRYKKNEKSRSSVQESSGKEQIGLHNRKRRSSKRTINEETKLKLLGEANLKQNNEITVDDSHDQNDIQMQEQNEVDQELDQVQTKENPELLPPEEYPDSNPILHGNGKRVWTRSQLKTVSKKDALSNNKEQAIESLQISRSPSLGKPLIELLKPISDDEPATGSGSTDVQDPISSLQDQQPEKLPVNGKGEYKRRGRRPKPMKPEKSKVKSQQSIKKGKVGKKKGQPKYKHHGRQRVLTRRSSRKKSC